MFKGGDDGAKWTLLGIETAVVKGFFSEIIILEGIFLPQKRISQKLTGIGKSWRSMTPLKLNKMGV